MLLDLQNLLSNKQDLAQAAGTYLSTNSIDLGAQPTDNLGNSPIHDVGRGCCPPELLVQVTDDFASAGAGTVDFQLVTGTGVDANGQINAGTKVMQTTGAIAKATLVKGYQARLRLPVGIDQRYLAVQYVIGTATMTAGKVTAGLVGTRQANPQV